MCGLLMEPLDSLRYRTSSRRSVCEVIREMYDISETIPDPAPLQNKLEEAYVMVKKMDRRLRELNDKTHKEYEDNPDFKADQTLRELRKARDGK